MRIEVLEWVIQIELMIHQSFSGPGLVFTADPSVGQGLQLGFLNGAELCELGFDLIEAADFSELVVFGEEGLLFLGHFDETFIPSNCIDLAIQLPEFGFISSGLLFQGLQDVPESLVLLLEKFDLGVITGKSILVGPANGGNAMCFVLGGSEIDASACHADGHGATCGMINLVLSERVLKFPEIVGGHGHDSAGHFPVTFEL